MVLIFGCLLVADPPRRSLGRGLNLVLLAFVAITSLAFLPANWFAQTDWRAALTDDLGIALPGTLSPQPWVTLGYLLSLVAGLSWLYYVCARELEQREVRRELRMFAAGIALLAGLCVALYLAHTTMPFWPNERRFGPFPNRNQTADLLGISAVVALACGYDDLRNGRKRWLLWLGAVAIMTAAIVLDFSRAGIVLLVAGSGFWLAVFAFRRITAGRLAAGFSLLLVLLTVLLLFGGKTLERFDLRGTGSYAGMSSELRWLIFRDAFDLVRHSPWCGLGLGNFDSVFAIFRNFSAGDTRALHPESDWLWLWTEAGWPALALALLGTTLLLRRVLPIGDEKNRRFRSAAGIAALLFALHGIVDVSAHRVGTAWSALFLLGLALRRPSELAASRSVPILFRCVGVCLILTGGTWTAAARWQWPLPGSLGAENGYAAASAASRGQNYEDTIDQTTRALVWTPLDWHLYFLRALGKIGAQRPARDALDDFRRARFLEPNGVDVPFEEGRAWLAKQPTLALTAWREALRRAGPREGEVYDQMLSLAQQYRPGFLPRLSAMAELHRGLPLIYLARTHGDAFRAGLDALLARDAGLQTLDDPAKTRLFDLWAERGDREKFSATLARHPEWESLAWSAMAKEASARHDFARAVALVRRFAAKPVLPTSSALGSAEDLQRTLATNPRNYAVGYALYQLERSAGRNSDALITVRRFTAEKEAPRYFHFLEMESWADDANWERAWRAWQNFDSQDAKPQAGRGDQ